MNFFLSAHTAPRYHIPIYILRGISVMNNKQLTRHWFDEVWNHKNCTTIDDLLFPDANLHGLSGTPTPIAGPGGFKQFHTAFLQAFPDIHVTLTHCFAEEDVTSFRFTFTATHTGPGFGPPTNRKVHATGLGLARWKDGKIAEAWNEFDRHGLFQQIAP